LSAPAKMVVAHHFINSIIITLVSTVLTLVMG
jgi:ABC-type glycerol-3-phosphate transport system permease component